MLHGTESLLLVILVYFIIVSIVLTMLWRIVVALDNIASHLLEISKDLNKLASRPDQEGK